MKIRKNMKKIINGVLIGVMVFSMAGMAFADNLNARQQMPRTEGVMQHRDGVKGEERKVNMDEKINQLVQAGVITQEQATKWKAFNEEKKAEIKVGMEKVKEMTKEERKTYFEKNKKNKGPKRDGFAELVEAGIFSQEVADQVAQKMHDIRTAQQEEKFKEHTNKLVEDGIITQSEATKWEQFHEVKIAERKAEMEKVKEMTQEERKAYFEEKKNNKVEKGDRLEELVEAGVISQDTADTIKSKAPQRPQRPQRTEKTGFKGKIRNANKAI